jgi:hypothetical protein
MPNPVTVIYMAHTTRKIYSQCKQRMSAPQPNSAKTGQFVLFVYTVLAAVTFGDPVYGDDVDRPVGVAARSPQKTNRATGSKKQATATSHFVSQKEASTDRASKNSENARNASFGGESGVPSSDLQSTGSQRDRGKSTIQTGSSSKVQLHQVVGLEASQDARAKSLQGRPTFFLSALNTGVPSKKSPYGAMHDTTGLRPYKPGVRYDRQNQRKSRPMFGGLFGRN